MNLAKMNVVLLVAAVALAVPTALQLRSDAETFVDMSSIPLLFDGFTSDNVGSVILGTPKKEQPAANPQAPNTSSAVSGTFSVRPTSCSAITIFGRDTAVLNPRNAVKSRADGKANASAPRCARTFSATSGGAWASARNGAGKTSRLQPRNERPSASHRA